MFAYLLIGLTTMLFVLFALSIAGVVRARLQAEKKIQQGLESAARPGRRDAGTGGLLHVARSTLRSLRVHLGMGDLTKVKQRLHVAGLRADWHSDAFLATRLLLPLLGLGLASFLQDNAFFWSLVFVFLGFMIPDFWLSEMVRHRRQEIQAALPDMLDLLVICVEAGLGLDQALYRVGTELHLRYPALSQELAHIYLEQRAGKTRIEAWNGMAQRPGLDEVENFVGMLWQTDRFGTPIVRALTTFADSLRTSRRHKAKEAAAKSTIKLIFPLVLFIFPSMFIVLIGPAALNVSKSLWRLFQ